MNTGLVLVALLAAAPGPHPGELVELRRHDLDAALCQRMLPSRISSDVIYLTTGKRVHSLSRSAGVALPVALGVRGLEGHVVDLAEDDGARLWVGTTRGIAGEGLPLDARQALDGQAISRVVSWPPGRVLVAGERGLYLVDDHGTRRLADPTAGFIEQVVDILPSPDAAATVAWMSRGDLALSTIGPGPRYAVTTGRLSLPPSTTAPGPLGRTPDGLLTCGPYELGVPDATGLPTHARLLPIASHILVTAGLTGPTVRRAARQGDQLYFCHGMTAPGLSMLSPAGWTRSRGIGAVFDFFVEEGGSVVYAHHDGISARTPEGDTVKILGVQGPGNHIQGLAMLPLGQGTLAAATERGIHTRQGDGTWSLLQAGEARQVAQVPPGAFALVGGIPYQVGRGYMPSSRRLHGVGCWAAAGDRWLVMGRDSTLILHDPILGLTRPAYELPGPCVALATSGIHVFASISGPSDGLWVGVLSSPSKPGGGPDLGSTQLEVKHVTFLPVGRIVGFLASRAGCHIATDRALYRWQEGKLDEVHRSPSEDYHFVASWGDSILLFSRVGKAALLDRQGKLQGHLDLPFLSGERVTAFESRGETAWIGTADSGLFEILATGRPAP